MLGLLLVFLVLVPSLPAQTSSYTISTVAGQQDRGDGGQAAMAWLDDPRGLDIDAAGNVYIADTLDTRVRRVAPNGTITTVAGNGIVGNTGDGGPAVAAQLSEARDVAVDAAGNLYIAYFGRTVRRVNPQGIIETAAGNGTFGQGGDGGPATEAQLGNIEAIDVDSAGNLYILTQDRIRRVSRGTITTFAGAAGTGFAGDGGQAAQAQFSGATDIMVDEADNIYVADRRNGRIRRIAAGGAVTTVAGCSFGPDCRSLQFVAAPPGATQAELSSIGRLWVRGGIITFLHLGRVYRLQSGTINLVAACNLLPSSDTSCVRFEEQGTAANVSFTSTYGIAVDSQGNTLLSTGTAHNAVVRITPGGTVTRFVGRLHFSGDGGPAARAQLNNPNGVAMDDGGNIYVADTANNRIRRIAKDGSIATVAGTGREEGPLGDGGPAAQATIPSPISLSLDATGNLLIGTGAFHENLRLRRAAPGGVIRTLAGTGDRGPDGDGGPATAAKFGGPILGLAAAADGTVYISDSGTVRRIDPAGTITAFAGTGRSGFSGDGGPANQAQLAAPSGLALDGAGNLYIADSGNNRVRVVGTDGIIQTFAGSGGRGFAGDGGPATGALFFAPRGVAVFPPPGAAPAQNVAHTVFIVDGNNNRIRAVAPDGTIRTIAGNGLRTFGGDGGPAVIAALNAPEAMAVGKDGVIYFTDRNNGRVRKLTPGSGASAGGVTNGASFATGALAPAMIASLFGQGIAPGLTVATGAQLPTELAGTRIEVTDSKGVTRPAGLFFVTASQANLQIPPEMALGPATVRFVAAGGAEASTQVQIEEFAPGIFSADATGRGVAAATAVRIDSGGGQTQLPVFEVRNGGFSAVPLPLGEERDQLVVLLFGTGFRGAGTAIEATATVGGEPAQVLGVAAQAQFVGVDQVNILISRSLAGRGEVDVVLTVNGKTTNAVTISIGR